MEDLSDRELERHIGESLSKTSSVCAMPPQQQPIHGYVDKVF